MSTEALSAFLAVARLMTMANRREYLDELLLITSALGGDPEQHRYLALNVARWPVSDKTKQHRHLVEFVDDPMQYVATAQELYELLSYTPGSLNVAFSTGRGMIDRTTRGTKLGFCKVHKLSDAVDLEAFDNVMTLAERRSKLEAARPQNRFRRVRS